MDCPTQPHTHSAAEVADALGTTELWVIRKARSGAIPARKIARRWRFTDADIEAAINNFTATTTYNEDLIIPTSRSRRW